MAKKGSAVFFVTGKGGAGKSTVAALLARGAVAGGLKAELVRVRDLDPRENLSALLLRTLRFRFLSDRLMDSSTFNAVAAAAPGLADLATLSAIVDAARPRSDAPDVMVVDAPASGHCVALLKAPARVLDLVGRGPVATIAREALALITDVERCRAVVVTIPEDLSVAEAVQLTDQLRGLGVEPGPGIVNGVLPEFAGTAQSDWLLKSGACADSSRYLAIRRRQLAYSDAFERKTGTAIHIPFVGNGAGRGAVPSDEQATRILTALMEGSL